MIYMHVHFVIDITIVNEVHVAQSEEHVVNSGVASGRAGRAQHDLNTQIKIQFSFHSELCPKNRATWQKIFLVSL